MGENVKLASIGLGWWGGVLAAGARDSGVASVVACFARTPERREAFAEAHGCEPVSSIDALFADSDIDGVLIATPHSTHDDLISMAAAAGKHVFVEKPLTLTVEEADRAIAATAAAGVVLQVGHNRRRQPANRRIRSMIDGGELGAVHHLEANHSGPLALNPDLPAWRKDSAETPGGGMTAMGVHQIDTFQYFAGPIARASAVSTSLSPDWQSDDTTAVIFEFSSGVIGQLVTCQATGPVVDVAVHGRDASAWNLIDGAKLLVQQRGTTDRREVDTPVLDTIADELVEFAAAIHGEASPETDGAVGRSVVAVLEAVVESAASGASVDVVS